MKCLRKYHQAIKRIIWRAFFVLHSRSKTCRTKTCKPCKYAYMYLHNTEQTCSLQTFFFPDITEVFQVCGASNISTAPFQFNVCLSSNTNVQCLKSEVLSPMFFRKVSAIVLLIGQYCAGISSNCADYFKYAMLHDMHSFD